MKGLSSAKRDEPVSKRSILTGLCVVLLATVFITAVIDMRQPIHYIVFFLVGAVILWVALLAHHAVVHVPALQDRNAAFLLIGGIAGLLFALWQRRMRDAQSRLHRRNLVLGAIRSINQLIFRERDPDRLLQGVCDILVDKRGYFNAWIALTDKDRGVTRTAQAGVGGDFGPFAARLNNGELARCMMNALFHSPLVITESPFSSCPSCPLSRNYANRVGISVRLAREDRIYGVLTVSLKKSFSADIAEHELISEIAADIAFGLHTTEMRKERRQADAALKENMRKLDNRVKELDCLFAISRLNERRHLSLDALYQGIADLLPSAWQYPDVTAARISVHDNRYATANFKETPWYQERTVFVGEKAVGKAAVYYLEKRPLADEGPFLKEEGHLLDTISARLGKITESRLIRDSLEESERRFRDLVENSLTGISIVQGHQVVYQNQEQERLLGPLPRRSILWDTARVHPADIEKVGRMGRDIASGVIGILDAELRLCASEKNEGGVAAVRWVYCRAIPIEYQGHDAILVNMMDVDKTKALEHLLVVQDKMASLGRVAAGIAHEIRNPLSGINIYLSTLEKMHQKGEPVPVVMQILSQLKGASVKIESVIKRVMDFSKPGNPRFSLIDINRPLDDALSLTAVTLRKQGILLTKVLDDALPQCHADPNLIEALILNLINNAAEALQAIPTEKKIRVSSERRGNRVCIRISDSGPGIPPEIREKIFDPFFTTKHEGTGIGLSLCHRIVSDHGGTMNVFPSRWGGAEFVITLPGESGEKEGGP